MTTLSEPQIRERLTEAMRARATEEVMVLRGLVAAIKNLKIERLGAAAATSELGEEELTQLVRREIKQREEALGFAERGGRADLVEKNAREKSFLETFLPKALSTEEIEAAVARHHEAGATSIGALMAKLKTEFGARLDGKVASEVARDFLRRREAS
jgi:uncharacterized protein YqeY